MRVVSLHLGTLRKSFLCSDATTVNINDHNNKLKTIHHISVNISGEELNSFTCKAFNRKGTQCRQCIDGYGAVPLILQMVILVMTAPNTSTCG